MFFDCGIITHITTHVDTLIHHRRPCAEAARQWDACAIAGAHDSIVNSNVYKIITQDEAYTLRAGTRRTIRNENMGDALT